ncbi:DUF1289 domain-containing protein [Acidovorax sp. SUPP3434]|uniref:DUF1289 domain-containing protein n=1 Tax=Acidovorax sp. SUPP3434 TaxID=2920880 RepID=UPI0023DE5CE7|nr:DUF1289 domain-containing protein [Acidovorax sp. SUPP3434]GKS98524.1 DUF1289 domain-containing protein [Acidovorax sp. SUPP3434]
MSDIESIANRAMLLSAGGYFDEASTDGVPSPCISVCRLSADGTSCDGCFRTLDEIRAWSGADDAERRAIWARLAQRAGFEFPPPSPFPDLP